MLTVPPLFSQHDVLIAKHQSSPHPFSSSGQFESLEGYIKWRGWNVESILLQHDVNDESTRNAALGLLSHPLTFPLTLSRHWPLMSGNKDVVRLCCVGARAECTLPDKYWRELLIAAITDTEQDIDVTIDFVGPDVPPQLSRKTIALDNNDEGSTSEEYPKCILKMNFHVSHLHEVVLKILKSQPESSAEQIKNVWDGYVLYNPGLGHPNLAKLWNPTLKFLIGTGKPILFTAHSNFDAERDCHVIEQMLADCNDDRIVKYAPNPYASRMEFVDPYSKAHVISPNHSLFLLASH